MASSPPPVDGSADVAAAEFFNFWKRNDLVEPSETYLFDHVCFALSAPPPDSFWTHPTKPFSLACWCAAIASWAVSSMVMVVVAARAAVAGRRRRRMEVSEGFLLGARFFLNQG